MKILMLLASMMFTPFAFGGDAFCDGFEEGYKSVKGDLGVVPVCPVEPVTPVGSNSWREGLKAGMRAAQSGR